MSSMRRREFIRLIGGAAAAWPVAARAQQPVLPTIGYLSTRSPGEAKYVTDAFAQGLNEIGYVESRNLVDPIPLGGPSIRSITGTSFRLGSPPSGGNRRGRRNPLGSCGKGGDIDNSRAPS